MEDKGFSGQPASRLAGHLDRKLIFLDIDGTLTPFGESTPPDSAVKAMQKARARGHRLFICTGRNPYMLEPLLHYGFDGFIGCAGGYVAIGARAGEDIDILNGEVLFDCPMPDEDFRLGMKLLGDRGVFRTIEAKDMSYGDEELGDFLAQAGEGNSELVRWRKALAEQLDIHPISEYDGRPIYKIVFMCTSASQLDDARAALEKDYNFIVQDVAAHKCLNGELINRKFDKGRGVRIIADYFNVPLSDTIGFGDSMNDLEMIETVGTSVCMENGSPLLKEKSDMVCPRVEEDGLYKGFVRLGLI